MFSTGQASTGHKAFDAPLPPAGARVDAEARLKEGKLINTSLLALSGVISALAGKHRTRFVPYRDSKLTMLLRNTFGGNSRTFLIVNVSPSMLNGRHSLSSLRFGAKASTIRNAPKANTALSAEELRRQLATANTMLLSQVQRLNHLQESLKVFREAAMRMLGKLPRGSRQYHDLVQKFSIVHDVRKVRKWAACRPVRRVAAVVSHRRVPSHTLHRNLSHSSASRRTCWPTSSPLRAAAPFPWQQPCASHGKQCARRCVLGSCRCCSLC